MLRNLLAAKFKQYVPGQSNADTGRTARTDANGFRVMLPSQPTYATQLTKLPQHYVHLCAIHRSSDEFEQRRRIQRVAASWDIRLGYRIPPLNPNAPSPLNGAAQATTLEGNRIRLGQVPDASEAE